jgi:hypothetical protein
MAPAGFGRQSLPRSRSTSSIDPKSRAVTLLFNPRRHKWHRHFRWRQALLVGRTAIGRATIGVLGINEPRRLALRESLLDEGIDF